MATIFSSSRADCAGLQSTATTRPAPCSSRLSALQPPLVSVSTVSSLQIFSTCVTRPTVSDSNRYNTSGSIELGVQVRQC